MLKSASFRLHLDKSTLISPKVDPVQFSGDNQMRESFYFEDFQLSGFIRVNLKGTACLIITGAPFENTVDLLGDNQAVLLNSATLFRIESYMIKLDLADIQLFAEVSPKRDAHKVTSVLLDIVRIISVFHFDIDRGPIDLRSISSRGK